MLKDVSEELDSVIGCGKVGLRHQRTSLGSGCGSVGRAIASNSSGLRFTSSHKQNLY